MMLSESEKGPLRVRTRPPRYAPQPAVRRGRRRESESRCLAALDGEREDRGLGGLPVDDLELVDSDGARFHRDIFACAGAFVRGLALQFDGGVARRHLHLFAEKSWQERFDFSKASGRLRPLADAKNGYLRSRQVSVTVQERSWPGSCLAAFAQVFGDARGLPDADGQHAAGGGVERAGVTGALLFEQLAHFRHHVVRGHACRFVDVEYAVHMLLSLVSVATPLVGVPSTIRDPRVYKCGRDTHKGCRYCISFFNSSTTYAVASLIGIWKVAPAARAMAAARAVAEALADFAGVVGSSAAQAEARYRLVSGSS